MSETSTPDNVITLPKRRWCYLQAPAAFEMGPCPCGNHETQWSEYEKHLWCNKCQKDFIPKQAGIFDGPIPVKMAGLLGISFDRVILETGEIERYDTDKLEYVKNETVEVRNNDCHRYRIPACREQDFQTALEKINSCKVGSSTWHDANEELNRAFGSYSVG